MMKQQKMSGYTPNYPKKAAALAAAALVALGTAAGCRYIRPETVGIVPMEEPTPIEDVQLEGYMMPEDLPTEEPLTTDGIVAATPEPEEVMLSGDVLVIDDMP